MKNHELDLDFRLLHLFLTIYQEGSVTAAANRLGMGQPSVSHGLERLRKIVGDPLFVRSGRGISPTSHADEMAIRVRGLLHDMRNLARNDVFDPDDSNQSARFVIGSNDYETAVILPELLARIGRCRADISIRVIPVSGEGPVVAALREGWIDLGMCLVPQGQYGDIAGQHLFDEKMRCFYEAAFHPEAPDTMDRYCAARHARVVMGKTEHSVVDDMLEQQGFTRRTALQVPTFASLATLMAGTDMIATMPARLAYGMMGQYASCDLPFDFPAYQFAQLWHVRNAASAPHRWLRGEMFRIARQLRAAPGA